MPRLGPVARSREAAARREAALAARAQNATRDVLYAVMRSRDMARYALASSERGIEEAEQAVSKWRNALDAYRLEAGTKAEPRDVRDLQGRIDISLQLLADRRHSLAAVKANLVASEAEMAEAEAAHAAHVAAAEGEQPALKKAARR